MIADYSGVLVEKSMKKANGAVIMPEEEGREVRLSPKT